jgi:hypothetical protein
MKKDLETFVYHLRLSAQVQVVEMVSRSLCLNVVPCLSVDNEELALS